MSRIRLTGSPESAPDGLVIQAPPFDSAQLWRSSSDSGLHPGWPAVFVTPRAYQQINLHAASDTSREVGGMLLGQAYQTPDGNHYVEIEAQLPAQHVDQGPAHLTFTSDTLTDLLNRQEEIYPDLRVVGWFHTHPGLSVFLSSYDVWLHTNFFPKPWHVALVIDPLANWGGFFRYVGATPGVLDPRHYTGFYELLSQPGTGSSTVTWQNLSLG